MPVTELDEGTALITIDFQHMIERHPTAQPLDEVVGNAAKLAKAFREAGLPVVNVRVSFSPDFAEAPRTRADSPMQVGQMPDQWDQYLPALGTEPSDLFVTKHCFSGFHGTDLDLLLRRRQITGLVLAGVSTGVGVEATLRSAVDHGYNVTVASDAVTDQNPERHANSLEHVFPVFAEIDETAAIIEKLSVRGAT